MRWLTTCSTTLVLSAVLQNPLVAAAAPLSAEEDLANEATAVERRCLNVPRSARVSATALALVSASPALAADSASTAAGARQPVAVVLAEDPPLAWVANQRSGTVSTLDLDAGVVVGELAVGRSVSDLAAVPRTNFLLATDPSAQRLVVLQQDGQRLRVQSRHVVPHDPVSVRVSDDGRRIAVASRWAHTVALFDEAALGAEQDLPARTVALPFAPRLLQWLPGSDKLLVTAAFGGRLAVVDADRGDVDSLREIPGHNMAGVALGRAGKRVHLTHQAIHRGAPASFDNVHWGGILTNIVRSVAVADLVDPRADTLAHNDTQYVGDIGRGAGDPAAIAIRADGLVVTTFAGVNEVAFDAGAGLQWKRVTVGARPTALALTADGQRAVVVNTLDDSVSIVSLVGSGRVAATLPLGAQRTPTAAERGERLFYDATLSHDGWFSCHSCHTDGHTNAQLVDNLTDGTVGTPKRVLSLLGVADTAPYAWDGHLPDLASQIRHSVLSTMQGDAVTDAEVADLAAYLRTLTPPPPPAAPPARLVERGRHVFERSGCVKCHAPGAFTTAAAYDVGLPDEEGRAAFNPPSLRGVVQGVRHFHDGRSFTLEDVVRTQQHQLAAPLNDADAEALLAFLKSL